MAMNRGKHYLSSDEKTEEITQLLQEMVDSEGFNTQSSYTADTTTYPDNILPFIDKHMNYMRAHQNISPNAYITNLRLMTRIG